MLRYNRLDSVPRTLSNCTNLTEFNVENNALSQLPEGLLSSLCNLNQLTLSRNQFTSYPVGGPAQFTTVQVSSAQHRCTVNKNFANKLFVYINTVHQHGAQQNH